MRKNEGILNIKELQTYSSGDVPTIDTNLIYHLPNTVDSKQTEGKYIHKEATK